MSAGDVKFIDASEWAALPWYNSGGTRAKRVLQSPDGKEWYFKCSEKKAAKDGKAEKYYRYEFWSEIIAYQLGRHLELEILRYDVAVHNNEIGCISPLMIVRNEEQLVEVGRYMTSLNEKFLPEDNSTRHEYTFQLLKETLEHFKLTGYWDSFFKTLLFDVIIGNTDRHQENWAFISKSSHMVQALSYLEGEVKDKGFAKLSRPIKWAYRQMFDPDKNELNKEGKQMKLQFGSLIGMAPVYDNGSSLARELTDERAMYLLEDEGALNKYVENGASELHWLKAKLSHFNLIDNLLNSDYLEQIKQSAGFLDLWNEQTITKIVNTIDRDLPENWHSYCIPKARKQLIIKLLHLRSQKLKELLHGRV